MATISIEIGNFGIKGCVRINGKIELLEIGNSMSPYRMPAVASIDIHKNVLVGAVTSFSDPLSDKIMYLSEYEYLDDDFNKVFTSFFQVIKDKAEMQIHESVTDVLVVIPPYFANKDPRKSKMEDLLRNNGILRVHFVSSDIANCYHLVNIKEGESVFVYDIGHSATHLSVVKRIGNALTTVSKREVVDCSGHFFENCIYSDIERKHVIP